MNTQGLPTHDNKLVVVGRLGSTFGVKGWIKIHSFTEEPTQICHYRNWFAAKDARPENMEAWAPLQIEDSQWQGDRLLVKLAAYDSPESVKELSGHYIAVAAEMLPPLAEAEFYWHQLLGLRVYGSAQGRQVCFGTIADLLETGANDVLVVRGKGCAEALDKQERLIPYLPDVVLGIDLGQGRVDVAWEADY